MKQKITEVLAGCLLIVMLVLSVNGKIAFAAGWRDITGEGVFSAPCGIALDSSGNMYIADIASNSIKRFANGLWTEMDKKSGGYIQINDIAVDSSGNIYALDSGNKTIKRFSNNTWTNIAGVESLSYPSDMAVDSSGSLYVTDLNGGVLKLSNGVWTELSTPGEFVNPNAVAVDSTGNVYVADAGIIKKWSGSLWTDITGSAGFSDQIGITVDHNGVVYATDRTNHIIKKLSDDVWTDISSPDDFARPVDITVDGSGNVYVVDVGTNQIKKLSIHAEKPLINTQPQNATKYIKDAKAILSITAMASDSGVLSYQWYSNTGNSTSGGQEIAGAVFNSYAAPTDAVGTTYYYAVVTNTNPDVPGIQTAEAFSHIAAVTVSGDPVDGWLNITGDSDISEPNGLAVDSSGNVYVADSWHYKIKVIHASGGSSDITYSEVFANPSDAAIDSKGNVYAADPYNNQIKKLVDEAWVDISYGEIWGNPSFLAVDKSGSVYVSDTFNNKIKKLSDDRWVDITGNENLQSPRGIAVDGSGNVYVVDSIHKEIKRLSTDGVWTNITGNLGLDMPYGIAVADSGMIYVTSVEQKGVVKKSAGDGNWTDITLNGRFFAPYDVAVDGSGNVYVTDTSNSKIKKLYVTNAAVPSIGIQPTGAAVNAGSTNPTLNVTATAGDGGTLSYQWYSSTANSTDDGKPISGATGSTYSVPVTQAGTAYYYVVVTNTNNAATGKTTEAATSSVVAVTVNPVQLPVYNVTLDWQDGSTPASIGASQGSKLPEIAVTARPGYTFEGWYKDAAETTKWNMDTDVVSNDVILYAKWMAITNGGDNGENSGGDNGENSGGDNGENSGGDSGGNNGGNNGGNTGENSGSNTGGSTGGTTIPANDDVIVLVNGKEEKIGRSAASTEDGRTVMTVTVDQEQLEAKLEAEGQGAVVTIPVSAESDIIIVELNGQMAKNMEDKQAVLVMQTGHASYTLPAQQLDIDSISKQMGLAAALENIKIQIRIAAPDAVMMKVVKDAAEQNALMLVAPSIDFTVRAAHAGKTVDVTKFRAYVERSIALPDGIGPDEVTTGIVTEPDGSVRHVPTRIVLEGGRYYARINSLSNSVYSVVWHPLTFKDLEGHWAQVSVNDMGSRLVVDGIGNERYNPDEDMTRAEFAAIVMRGMGMKPFDGKSPFADVTVSDWYYSAVLTAYDYDLIEGFEDGTFRPQEKITREQAMVILSKAMVITGLKENLTDKSIDELLKPYTDAADVSEWAKAGVAASLQAGVVSGRGADQLAPKANITRAEVAAIVQRLLKTSNFI
jgi:uncharacterized repeat protein (TIGR02543 family)